MELTGIHHLTAISATRPANHIVLTSVWRRPGSKPHAVCDWRLNVEVVISTPDGVVLVKRDIEPCKGQWHLPGGTVRFAEPLPSAVQRVAWDELSVKVQVGELIGYIEYPQMLADGYAGWPVGFAFAATVTDGVFTGGDQGRDIDCFRTAPVNTIVEQARFLTAHGLTTPGLAPAR